MSSCFQSTLAFMLEKSAIVAIALAFDCPPLWVMFPMASLLFLLLKRCLEESLFVSRLKNVFFSFHLISPHQIIDSLREWLLHVTLVSIRSCLYVRKIGDCCDSISVRLSTFAIHVSNGKSPFPSYPVNVNCCYSPSSVFKNPLPCSDC